MLGGGIRQAGVIAAGIVALEQMIDRLAEDHQHARHFAQSLAELLGIDLDLDTTAYALASRQATCSANGANPAWTYTWADSALVAVRKTSSAPTAKAARAITFVR